VKELAAARKRDSLNSNAYLHYTPLGMAGLVVALSIWAMLIRPRD
jgi:hypothetical protein